MKKIKCENCNHYFDSNIVTPVKISSEITVFLCPKCKAAEFGTIVFEKK